LLGIRILALSIALTVPSLCAASAGPAAPMVVGYVFPQNSALQPGEIDALSLTRINYAFANIENGRIVTGFAEDAHGTRLSRRVALVDQLFRRLSHAAEQKALHR